MVGVCFGNIIKDRALCAKGPKGGRVLMVNRRKGGGSGRNRPSSSPFSRPEQGRGVGSAGGGRFGPPGPGQRPGLRGKERGSRGGLIPGLTSSDDGAWRPGYCDQRRRSYKVGGGGAGGAGSS